MVWNTCLLLQSAFIWRWTSVCNRWYRSRVTSQASTARVSMLLHSAPQTMNPTRPLRGYSCPVADRSRLVIPASCVVPTLHRFWTTPQIKHTPSTTVSCNELSCFLNDHLSRSYDCTPCPFLALCVCRPMQRAQREHYRAQPFRWHKPARCYPPPVSNLTTSPACDSRS